MSQNWVSSDALKDEFDLWCPCPGQKASSKVHCKLISYLTLTFHDLLSVLDSNHIFFPHLTY